jgi:hypothetical protein
MFLQQGPEEQDISLFFGEKTIGCMQLWKQLF